jgi:AbrB family looped-hinge helix DNA binding protein
MFFTLDHDVIITIGITMRELETRLTQKGQVTIPAEVRARLGLKPKDVVRFEIEGDVVKLKPATSRLLEGYGAVAPVHKPEDWKKVRTVVEQDMAEEVKAEDH